jgi:large subunit ribosomal protein L25
MAKQVLSARTRDSKGKGAARKFRKNKQIPAIFYGPDTEPVMLAADYPELERIIRQSSGENIILDLKVESEDGTEIKSVILKELQVDPITDIFLHADFYEITMDKEITVPVPVHLINTPVGVTDGGILQHVRRELTVSCLPDKLIEALEVDVSGLDIGDSVHVRDIRFPEGITSLDEEHLTVAVVAAPTVMPEEVEEEVEEEAVEEEAAEEGAVEEKQVKEEKGKTAVESGKES